ncbi:hypothetical protein CJA_2644 [Cellvibrio japonicus Ueda107]|uniref:Uncharacterized protein n=1 Tax=Cellvibrio japonicus (strain Ueda107) TaxID=498211 RepID=B3PLM3_CELJU|nr:hypothetical protein CJA_2644 [Cellvibrio japonicus Ueda107]
MEHWRKYNQRLFWHQANLLPDLQQLAVSAAAEFINRRNRFFIRAGFGGNTVNSRQLQLHTIQALAQGLKVLRLLANASGHGIHLRNRSIHRGFTGSHLLFKAIQASLGIGAIFFRYCGIAANRVDFFIGHGKRLAIVFGTGGELAQFTVQCFQIGLQGHNGCAGLFRGEIEFLLQVGNAGFRLLQMTLCLQQLPGQISSSTNGHQGNNQGNSRQGTTRPGRRGSMVCCAGTRSLARRRQVIMRGHGTASGCVCRFIQITG